MKKFLVNLFCSFIPLKAKRDAIRNKYFPKKIAPDIWQTMNMNNHIEIAEEDKAHVSLSIQGVNNTVIIKKLCMGFSGHICISLTGNNCNIVLDEGIWVSQLLHIVTGQIHPNFGSLSNVNLEIGANSSCESCFMAIYNSKT